MSAQLCPGGESCLLPEFSKVYFILSAKTSIISE